MNKPILTPLIAALALTALPTLAAIGRVYVDEPPPPLMSETVPPAREGYTWAPGYWQWNGTKYEWTQGHWISTRSGYRYVAPKWTQEEGRWTLYPESWVKNEDDKEKTVSKDSSLPALR